MPTRRGPYTVVPRFPGQWEKLKRLFEQNTSFRSLCNDHMRCAKALRYWQQSVADEAPARREEYAKILQDLEGEILKSLDEAE